MVQTVKDFMKKAGASDEDPYLGVDEARLRPLGDFPAILGRVILWTRVVFEETCVNFCRLCWTLFVSKTDSSLGWQSFTFIYGYQEIGKTCSHWRN